MYGNHSPERSPTVDARNGNTARGPARETSQTRWTVADTFHKGDGVRTYLKKSIETPVPVGAHLPLEDGELPPVGYPINGNADAALYFTPASPSYKRTTAHIWFATESAAQAAGFKTAG